MAGRRHCAGEQGEFILSAFGTLWPTATLNIRVTCAEDERHIVAVQVREISL